MEGTGGNRRAYIFAGLAGETAPGRVIKSGLYRAADWDGQWDLLSKGLPEAPAIRALAIHPLRREIVYAGTQEGPYRSYDHGDHWEKVNVPDHGLPVWSLLFHPRDADIIHAGYENCEIYRSEDGGEHWRPLPVSVRFPEITLRPGANPAKRVLMMAASKGDSAQLFAALEVGGIIRTLDGGNHWENLSHGLYVNDDQVDMHGVLVSSWRPGTILTISRAGMFRSTDLGDHWEHVPLEPLNEKGQTYCRQIREVPGDPMTIWVGAGATFGSRVGTLFRSVDGGLHFERVDMGVEPGSTIVGLAFDEHQPTHIACATSNGKVFVSVDRGGTWSPRPLPAGADQVYALAYG
jgi:photosystem II stability/assembly factor-like uncharacterized protein